MSRAPANLRTSPELKVTQYDKVSSSLIAGVTALLIAVIWLAVLWATNRIPDADGLVPIEMLDFGGDPEGAENEELLVESPEEEVDDPSVEETPEEEVEIQELLEDVVELSEQATNLAQEQFDTATENSGKVGSHAGNGRKPLGSGPGSGGFPSHQRWFIRFADRGTLDEYARQLDFFGIELAVLFPTGRMVMLRELTKSKPDSLDITDSEGRFKRQFRIYNKRLHMTWQGGSRKKADNDLFRKAGVTVGNGVIFHFYPTKTERLLGTLELRYRNKPADSIRRTYYVVKREGRGYKFEVTRQSYIH